MNKKFLTVLCGLALTFGLTTAAQAGDEDAGYNTSSGDTTVIGSDPNTGGATASDAAAMQDIQSGTESMKDRWSGDAQRQAVENGN